LVVQPDVIRTNAIVTQVERHADPSKTVTHQLKPAAGWWLPVVAIETVMHGWSCVVIALAVRRAV